MKRRLTFDQAMYLIVAAPAIFFGWFTISGIAFAAGSLYDVKRLKLVGIDIFSGFESVGGGDNAAMILGLVFAFFGSVVMSRKTIRDSWPADKSTREREIELRNEEE